MTYRYSLITDDTIYRSYFKAVEQSAFQIDFKLPVESPTLLTQRTTTLKVYTCPSDQATGLFMVKTESLNDLTNAATNSYAGCFGEGGLLNTQPEGGNGVFQRNSKLGFRDITDGSSSTLAVGERGAILSQTPWAGVMSQGVAYTRPGAPVFISIIELAPTMALARIGNKPLNDSRSEPYDFFSAHGQVVHFLFADGSVQALTAGTNQAVLKSLATYAGSEVVGGGDY